jgi:hypothetical protein
MTILTIVHIAMLLSSGLTKEIQQAASATADAARQRDVYAIYSQLISSSDEIYLIEAGTLTQKDGHGSLWRPASGAQPYPPCVQARPADAASLAEILADYEARKDVPAALQREFTLDKSYQLLGPDEVRTFLQDALNSTSRRLSESPSNPNPLFPGARRVFRLGDVYFNKNRSLALTYVSVLTTTIDGGGGWWPFRKTDQGQWVKADVGRLSDANWQVCGWESVR